MVKLSVVVSCFNEELNIERCLKSAVFAQEIIVVDHESSDRTLEIAKKFTQKIFVKKNEPSKIDIQKNFGFEKATGDWILSIDADEEVTPELQKEVKELLSSGDTLNGYYIPRKNIIFGKWMEHTGWYPDFQLRLFRKGEGEFVSEHVHEAVKIEGKTGYLSQHLIHYNYQTVSQFISRTILYSQSEAASLLNKGYVFSWMDVVKFPVNEFFSRFFAREGYKDGLHGLVLSLLMAFYHLIVFANIWEKEKFKEVHVNMLQETEKMMLQTKKDFYYWFYKEREKQTKNVFKKIILKTKNKLH